MRKIFITTDESPAMQEALAGVLVDYLEGTMHHPFSKHLRIWRDRVIFEVTAWDRAIQLGLIQTIYKGCGEGSQGLKWLVALAKEHNVPIKGHVQRVGKIGLSKNELVAWYRRHGFKVNSFGEMIYRPEEK